MLRTLKNFMGMPFRVNAAKLTGYCTREKHNLGNAAAH
jgi:hypothetical protein